VLWKTWHTLQYLTSILGFVISSDSKPEILSISDQQIEEMIQLRKEAKKNKNWKEGDRIRDELKAQGITLIDQAGGEVRWHRS
jgi:cysteinyl-tRNA synthetase